MGPAVVVGGGATGAAVVAGGAAVVAAGNTGVGEGTEDVTGGETTGVGCGFAVDEPSGRNVFGRPEVASALQAAIIADSATAAWVGWIRWMRIGPTEGDGFTETQLCT